jgi:hypothetical protein
MQTIEYEFSNILELPRIKELLKMKCFRVDDYSWMGGCNFQSETQEFLSLCKTTKTAFTNDRFFIEVENAQREYKGVDENSEIIEYDIGEILVGDYTKLIITEIEWICYWSKNLGHKRIYKWNEVAEFGEKPPF